MSSGGPEITGALARLDQITRRLRRECPWDREQDERTIVPHTLEEAYELADAAHRRDDAKLIDELGDVLFQVHFLSLLLEERGAGDLAEVATHATDKLIRRHPHVFGEAEVRDAAEVLANWDAIKRTEPGREPGVFGEVPENLPGPLYARKVQRRAASTGFDFAGIEQPLQSVARRARRAARGADPGRALPRARRPPVRRRQRRPQTPPSIPSSRFVPPPTGSVVVCRRASISPRHRAGTGTIWDLKSSWAFTCARVSVSRTSEPDPPRSEPDMSQIEHVHARQILDSRGNPTIEVELSVAVRRVGPRGRSLRRLDGGVRGDRAARRRHRLAGQGRRRRPSRTSTARSRRRSGAWTRPPQAALDRTLISLDGTPNKSRLGANAILAVSLAAAHAAAAEERLPLWRYLGGEGAHVMPVPMMNVINGGVHADNKVDFQEFMIVPVGATSFGEALKWGSRSSTTSKTLRDRGLGTAVGDEGGFAPDLDSNEAALEALVPGDHGGRLSARRAGRDRARSRRPGVYKGGAYVLEHEHAPQRR